MKDKLKAWWPAIAHAAGVTIVFLSPAVEALAKSHPGSAVAVTLAWGWLLHWAKSPKQ